MAATARSALATNWQPAAVATPWTRAMTGWGDSAMRAARASGLKPVYLHNRVFYRGCDVMNYIHSAADDQAVVSSHRGGADDGR